MNQKVLRLWVEALLSGKYTQTRNALQRIKETEDTDGTIIPVGYCCLGVLCELAYKHAPFTLRKESSRSALVIYGDRTGMLPEQVARWLREGSEVRGIDVDVWVNLPDGNRATLTQLNDSGENFRFIAERLYATHAVKHTRVWDGFQWGAVPKQDDTPAGEEGGVS